MDDFHLKSVDGLPAKDHVSENFTKATIPIKVFNNDMIYTIVTEI